MAAISHHNCRAQFAVKVATSWLEHLILDFLNLKVILYEVARITQNSTTKLL